MAISVDPNSTIVLVKTPLENDYKNTFTFNTYANQLSYFNSLPGKQIIGTDYTYIKKDNKIRVGVNYDDIIKFNYLYYDNEGFGESKRYYCFIDKMEYINENCTDIYIQTDVFQTWYFDIEWNRCFVEREHVNDDTFGLHTIPEGLDKGEFVINNSKPMSAGHYQDMNLNTYIVVALTNPIVSSGSGSSITPGTTVYNKLFSGLYYVTFKTPEDCSKFIKALTKDGHADYIQNVFVLPKKIVGADTGSTWLTCELQGITFEFMVIQSSNTPVLLSDEEITINTSLNGYTPKNNKMFTGEFNYIILNNNAGSQAIFNYEDFVTSTAKFRIVGSIAPGGSIKCLPQDYKKFATSTDRNAANLYSINGAKYPTCSWNYDAYTNWLTQNALNIGLDTARIVGKEAMALGTANVSASLSGVNDTFNLMKQINAASYMPNQASGNTNAGDISFSGNMMNFNYLQMSVRYEYAKICDDFLSLFGYKVNTLKVPNITGRRNWNFIKTIDCNADGDIPQEDLNVIKDACNRGITFWHTPANIYKYNLDNSIV